MAVVIVAEEASVELAALVVVTVEAVDMEVLEA